MHRTLIPLTALLAGMGAVWAHEGVTDPAVKAWMHGMKQIGAQKEMTGLDSIQAQT